MVVFWDEENMELQARISKELKKVEKETLLWNNILKNCKKQDRRYSDPKARNG